MKSGAATCGCSGCPSFTARSRSGKFGCCTTFTERKHKEQELATLASTDALTGLPNRRSFMAMLEQYQESANETIAAGAVLVLDVGQISNA